MWDDVIIYFGINVYFWAFISFPFCLGQNRLCGNTGQMHARSVKGRKPYRKALSLGASMLAVHALERAWRAVINESTGSHTLDFK